LNARLLYPVNPTSWRHVYRSITRCNISAIQHRACMDPTSFLVWHQSEIWRERKIARKGIPSNQKFLVFQQNALLHLFSPRGMHARAI